MTLYATGVRRAELARLKVSDIDSGRMVVHIQQGKGVGARHLRCRPETLYRDVRAHYFVTALPCRVRDPDRNGKVESGVGHAQKTPLKGQRFESLAGAQAYLDHWEERWADKRIHGRTKRQLAAMFAEEKPMLTALPLEPFRYYNGKLTVHLDGCVEGEAAYYGAPPGWIGRQVCNV